MFWFKFRSECFFRVRFTILIVHIKIWKNRNKATIKIPLLNHVICINFGFLKEIFYQLYANFIYLAIIYMVYGCINSFLVNLSPSMVTMIESMKRQGKNPTPTPLSKHRLLHFPHYIDT